MTTATNGTSEYQDAGVEPTRRSSQRKDHRAALQANKLRLSLATEAIRFGNFEPTMKPKTLRILLVSLLFGCIIIVATIGAATVLQMFGNR